MDEGESEKIAKVVKKKLPKVEENKSKKEHVNVVFIGHVGESSILFNAFTFTFAIIFLLVAWWLRLITIEHNLNYLYFSFSFYFFAMIEINQKKKFNCRCW